MKTCKCIVKAKPLPCRFYLADDWTAKKLEVLVDIPDKLQLEHLRAKGLQPGELTSPRLIYQIYIFQISA